MKNFIVKYEIWIFLILAPIFNAIVVYIRTLGIIPENVYNHGRFAVLLVFLVTLVGYTRGLKGVKEMFLPMLNWKINAKWYLLGLVFAFSMGCLTLMVKGGYKGEGLFSLIVIQKDDMYPLLALILWVWAFCGEVVWVSYCIRELSKRMSPYFASQIVGFVWGMWWFPVVYLGEGVIPDLPYWTILLGMMGAAGMCAVMYGYTKSGLAVWLLQYMVNMSLILLPISPKVGGVPTYLTFVFIYYSVMMIFMHKLYPKGKFALKKV